MTKDQVKEILQDLPIEVYTAVKWHIKEGENNMYHLQLNERELRDLLLSVQFDRTGKYGDERSYRLEKLETKLKRVKPIEGEGK